MGLVILCLLLGAVYYFGRTNESSAEDPSDKTEEPQVRPDDGQTPAVLPTDSIGDRGLDTLESSTPSVANEDEGEDAEAPTAPSLDVDQGTGDDHARPGTVKFDPPTENNAI